MAGESRLDQDKVELPLSEVEEYLSIIDLPRTLMDGTDAMRGKTSAYLPQEEGESDKAYESRLNRSFLLNAYKRTVQKLTGEVFGKEIILSEDVPNIIAEYCEDIDRNGKGLNRWSQQVFFDGLSDGVIHVLVDYPQVQMQEVNGKLMYWEEHEDDPTKEPEWLALTKAVESSKAWRPYVVIFRGDQVVGWRAETKEGRSILTQLRLKETVEKPAGAFGVSKIERIRVLEPGKFEIWDEIEGEGGDKEWILINQGTTSINFIPFTTFMPGEQLSLLTARPPLEGLAQLNLCHWQSSSDQRHILHFSRMPVYFGKCIEPDEEGKITFGSNRLLLSDDPNADLKVVESTGAAINAGRVDIQDLERQMALFGLTYMMPRSGNVTATERALNTSESDSTLRQWALTFQDFVEQILDYMNRIIGNDPGEAGSVGVNTEFGSILNDLTGQLLVQAFREGVLPREVVIEEFKRRGTIKDDWDFVELIKMLDQDMRKRSILEFEGGTSEEGEGETEEGEE